MLFAQKYANLTSAQVEMVSTNLILSDTEGPCFMCKAPTHFVDIDYQAYVCSEECVNAADKDAGSR